MSKDSSRYKIILAAAKPLQSFSLFYAGKEKTDKDERILRFPFYDPSGNNKLHEYKFVKLEDGKREENGEKVELFFLVSIYLVMVSDSEL